MPEFSYRDRLMVKCEQSLQTVTSLLKEEFMAIGDSSFGAQLKSLLTQANGLAQEVQNYNDQFEVDE